MFSLLLCVLSSPGLGVHKEGREERLMTHQSQAGYSEAWSSPLESWSYMVGPGRRGAQTGTPHPSPCTLSYMSTPSPPGSGCPRPRAAH